MKTASQRKKDPELVRRTLLDCAMRLALEHGPAGLTVQAVAEAAGVTKGGLFHHFPSKQALVEGLFADLVDKLDADIDAAMAEDPRPRGSFTRAYVRATFDDLAMGRGNPAEALYMSALAEPSVLRMWAEWFAARLARHRATDDTPSLEIVRMAADGAWLAYLMREDGDPAPDAAGVRERLITMTLTD